MAGVQLKPLPPKDAIAYFRSKGYAISFDWRDLWQEEHARSFTVAKMASRDLLETTRALLDRAMAEGTTFEQFRAELAPQLKAAGWWGRQEMTDPLTGDVKVVQLGSDRRLRTIFNTNLRVASAVGNWQRAWANRALMPFMMYKHNSFIDPRLEHVAWDGLVLPITHPWWQKHYPPCGWGCLCSTLSFSQRMLDARGLKVSEPPKFQPIIYTNPRTGEISQIEKGIDPGWDYNVGQAPLRPLTARPEPAPSTLSHGEMTGPINAFLDAMEAKTAARVIKDRDSWPVVIGRDLFRDVNGKVAVPRPDLVDELPTVAKALKAHQRASWEWGSRPKVPSIYPEDPAASIADIVKAEATAGGANPGVTFEAVSHALAEEVKFQGHNVEGFNHSLDTGFVRHVMKNHGDPAVEATRRQLAIVAKDFEAIPSVVSAPDHLIFGTVGKDGGAAIMYVKDFGTHALVYVEDILTGGKKLAGSTMYKRTPAAASPTDIVRSLSSNVLNDGRNTAIIVSVAGKIKPALKAVVPYLIRRYTARLDNKLVTVDFFPGTWTYDVQQIP